MSQAGTLLAQAGVDLDMTDLIALLSGALDKFACSGHPIGS